MLRTVSENADSLWNWDAKVEMIYRLQVFEDLFGQFDLLGILLISLHIWILSIYKEIILIGIKIF